MNEPMTKRTLVAMLTLLSMGLVAMGADPPSSPDDFQWDEEKDGPLPRWREGGTPEVDPNQPIFPYTISFPTTQDAPDSGLIESPPEYTPSAGVIYRYSSGAWPEVVSDLVVALTSDPGHDEIAWVVVSSPSQQANATNRFTAAGADMSKVEFIVMPNNSIWLRDYGPHFIWQDGALGIVDSHYYPTRSLDNFIPTNLADNYFGMPSYDMGLYYSGGNFQPGPGRTGFITSLINQDNPGFGALINEQYLKYQGIDTVHLFPRLPSSVDGTGHIDMWFYLVDDQTVVISEFIPGSNPTAINITNNAADFMENTLGYDVYRVPDSNSNGTSGIHYTYANAFRVNDRIFIPTYGEGNPSHLARDAQAMAVWQEAAPDVEIIPINCYGIIPASGAIHCIVMQVPLYTNPLPSAHLISPHGGELFIEHTVEDIAWVATDDEEIASVDIYLSTNGGDTYAPIAQDLPDSGHYDWSIPTAGSSDALVKVVAVDGDGNDVSAISVHSFMIAHAIQRVYDFSDGAGVDKWGWGYQTTSWAAVDNIRRPAQANAEISTLQSGAYGKLAYPDAIGTDFDLNRYRAPTPQNGRETTHIFEFMIDENTENMLDIEILWEGYADACLQIELYIWDYVEGQWGDGNGLYGENRYMDNHATNVDQMLIGHVTENFDRYLDANGKLTVLLYGERSTEESFHDYLAVTVTTAYDGDYNQDGNHTLDDLDAFQNCVTGPAGGILTGCDAGDLDADGDIDFGDFYRMQQLLSAE